MFLTALLRHQLLATIGISAVIIALAVLLSIVSYQSIGRKDPGLAYEILSAMGISALLAPTFLYPWIRTAAKLRQATLEITKLATTDALTGLANPRVLRSSLEEVASSIGKDGSAAVLFVDLAEFHQVNETLGHLRGDALLTATAERLRQLTNDNDLIVRFGGDEFVILRRRIGAAEAAALASEVIETLSRPFVVEGHEVVIGASIGIAIAPTHGTAPEELLRNADLALCTAKARNRRSWLLYEPVMAAAVQAKRNLEMELRAAYERRAFEVYYQPLVDLRTMQVSTCEALLRWPSTDSRIRTPDEFIPVAEDIGLMAEIGEWVLHSACRECATWPGSVRVAVNLSPTQFTRSVLVKSVQSALAKAGLPPNRLELEITESLALGDFATTRATLEQLRAFGVRIALDDFGTGYSSLSYLNSLPLDKVKIDRSFVLALSGSARSVALLRGITELSNAIGLIVAVEGIETEDQLDAIVALGAVHEAQGYLLGAPMPDRRIAEFLTAAGRAAANVGHRRNVV
ncbi:MAG TPA: EAL domain-containing protein [Bauldia sp.]|nr:EAL domain-containing protein [Bauldia sp.]